MNGDASIAPEVARRRTFAIISHPDAGKTTLTEKLLLYGGAISTAGQVAARRRQRAGHVGLDGARARARHLDHVDGAAVPLRGFTINLLDTPGHQDFGEDTYRTLLAADSAVMLIDAAKGVEPQTKKLFAICRARAHPALHVHQQDGPPEPRPARTARRTRERAGHRRLSDQLADRQRPVVPRRVTTGRRAQVHLFERTTHGAKRRRSR